MGGRRRLVGGFRVWLPDHRRSVGAIYRRALKAGLELAGVTALNGSELLRVEVERYAKAAVLHDEAARHWADLLNKRQAGKGRRPTERRVERAARRVGLADMTLRECTARLEALAAQRRKPTTGAELLAQLRRGSA